MLTIKKITQLNELSELKQAYFSQSTSPLDGMWHFGFVPMAAHYGFYDEKKLVGFCCVKSDGYMLQFYLPNDLHSQINDLFALIIQGKESVIGDINGAFVSTAEPQYLSLCFDNLPTISVNALMYQHMGVNQVNDVHSIEMTLADTSQLEPLVAFAVNAISAPKEWLMGYYRHLIERQELWFYAVNQEIAATGECRRFDDIQTQYVDLGVIVAPTQRNQGLATRVLNHLVELAKCQGLKAICSTESANLGAQKAIAKAGFFAPHRIVQFDF